MKDVRPSPTLAITARAKQLMNDGIDVIGFGAGEPDFNTPQPICDAAIDAIQAGITKYTPSAGLPILKEAVVEKLWNENRLRYGTDQVVVSCGAKHSVYNAFMVLLEPGDEVILLAPYWMTYRDQIVLAGGVPVVVQTRSEDDFVPDLDQLRAAITPKTKAIMVNSPCNPTGAVLPHQTLKDIAALAIKHDFWVISDEIYEHLRFEGEHESFAALGKEIYERTLTITGCSKSYSMTGWRIGFTAGPKEVVKAISTLQDQMTSNPTSFAQIGAIAALKLPSSEIDDMRETFRSRRDAMLEALSAIPQLSCPTPKGAFYCFPGIQASLSDEALAQRMLEEAHVAVVPGSVFEGPGHLRLTYACSEDRIREGVKRIGQFLQALEL